jgi:DNA polymerase-3 subunit delta'
MPFDKIILQNHVVTYFQCVIAKRQLSHAYIFTGQKGLGKSLFAKELSKTLICEKKKNEYCDVCRNCIRIEEQRHPDIHWYGADKNDKFLKIECIRDLQYTASLSPVETSHKIFILQDAEKMNEEAANCLLKTLEEPTPNTLFILTVNSLSGLKETIISRCQVVRFQMIKAQIIKKQLTGKYNCEQEEIEWASVFCGGSLGRAIELIEEGFFRKNSDIIKSITGLKRENNFICAEGFLTSSTGASDSSEEVRQTLKNFLNCILSYYRDMLICKICGRFDAGHGNIPLFNAHLIADLQEQSKRLHLHKITSIIDELLLSLKYLDYNTNINLLIENLTTSLSLLNPSYGQ